MKNRKKKLLMFTLSKKSKGEECTKSYKKYRNTTYTEAKVTYIGNKKMDTIPIYVHNEARKM